ncbi:hypothetical protein J3458_006958 [Metarhizium acridum]|uniref:uncharacterized protein n=1 Tax=Metarhizium acridum TaxID=92637 RepID=UPI001C6BEE28|nr:hypothetical protein J3458_006958 [Metarhizium acridum]
MARALGVPSNLPSLIKTTFAKALSGGDLHYFPTKVTILPVNSVPFQLRFSPALANKPKPPQDASLTPKKPFDPFANPPPALYIADVGPSHYLVLNKFAIVPEHFILATKEFKQQTDVLEEADLEATLACMEAFESEDEGEDGGLFAFFNCGEHSGASQPHRHIQLLPIDRMRDGLESENGHHPWNVLADGEHLEETPFVVFSEPITPGMSGAEVYSVYLRLYGQACKAIGERNGAHAPAVQVTAGAPSQISYNMAMTKSRLVICPRLAEGGPVRGRNGEDMGRLALNGTLLAGTALVKNEAEWDALRENPACLADVLRGIGLPRDVYGDEGANRL